MELKKGKIKAKSNFEKLFKYKLMLKSSSKGYVLHLKELADLHFDRKKRSDLKKAFHFYSLAYKKQSNIDDKFYNIDVEDNSKYFKYGLLGVMTS